jgi:hypothetical protein
VSVKEFVRDARALREPLDRELPRQPPAAAPPRKAASG